MKVFKNGTLWTKRRYKSCEEVEDLLLKETRRMYDRLERRGIVAHCIPVLTSGRGPATGENTMEVFVCCPALTNFFGPNPNSENIVLLRQLARNFSRDAGEILRKEIGAWSKIGDRVKF